jgi:hypothetical protein
MPDSVQREGTIFGLEVDSVNHPPGKKIRLPRELPVGKIPASSLEIIYGRHVVARTGQETCATK